MRQRNKAELLDLIGHKMRTGGSITSHIEGHSFGNLRHSVPVPLDFLTIQRVLLTELSWGIFQPRFIEQINVVVDQAGRDGKWNSYQLTVFPVHLNQILRKLTEINLVLFNQRCQVEPLTW